MTAKADGTEVAFFIPIGCDPAPGEAISWGRHHAWRPGEKVDKLSWEMAL